MNLDIHIETNLKQSAINEAGENQIVPAIEAKSLNVRYGEFLAVEDVDIAIKKQNITALIGPSGCGKSTVLRAFNRMNDLIPIASTSGEVLFHGQNIYRDEVDPVELI
jgi:phosphate transport system ATP-binding protein